jgi:hypothetical protein
LTLDVTQSTPETRRLIPAVRSLCCSAQRSNCVKAFRKRNNHIVDRNSIFFLLSIRIAFNEKPAEIGMVRSTGRQ